MVVELGFEGISPQLSRQDFYLIPLTVVLVLLQPREKPFCAIFPKRGGAFEFRVKGDSLHLFFIFLFLMFLYFLLLPFLQLIPSFVDILKDPNHLLLGSLLTLPMSYRFGVKVIGLHGLVKLKMCLTTIQPPLFFFDLVDLLLLLYAFLEDLLYHVGLLSLEKLRGHGVEGLVGHVLTRGIEDWFFAGVDQVLYLFWLVLMGCYFFLQLYTFSNLPSLVNIQLPTCIFGPRVERGIEVVFRLKSELWLLLVFEEIPT